MPEVFVTIKEGGELVDEKPLKRFFTTLPPGPCSLEYKDRRRHSSNQRGYYWSVILPHSLIVLKDYGCEGFRNVNDVHEYFKYLLNPIYLPDPEFPNDPDKKIRVGGSTKKMTKSRYKEFIDEALAWAANKGYYIPEPLNSEEKYLRT